VSERKARHAMDPAVIGMSLEDISRKYVARFGDRKPDWNAFADASIEGWRRAQHRFIGNTSGKRDQDDKVIPARAFTLSIMYVPSGQGNAAHTHEVEEVFFVLQGRLMVFFEDETGKRVETVLGPWDCCSCPAGVIHGYQNDTVDPVYLIVQAGKANVEFMGFADPELYKKRDQHVRQHEESKRGG
jgi:mannose-6-phosphate isomerase-like protein (cupin superfamily)